jgi:hypothetical protein
VRSRKSACADSLKRPADLRHTLACRATMAEAHRCRQATRAQELGQIQLVFLELPKYDTSRPPRTMVEKWAYFFREADNLTVIPEVLAEHPFIDALDAARTAGFTADEWEAYILAGIAIQNERGALTFAEKRGDDAASSAANSAANSAACGRAWRYSAACWVSSSPMSKGASSRT